MRTRALDHHPGSARAPGATGKTHTACTIDRKHQAHSHPATHTGPALLCDCRAEVFSHAFLCLRGPRPPRGRAPLAAGRSPPASHKHRMLCKTEGDAPKTGLIETHHFSGALYLSSGALQVELLLEPYHHCHRPCLRPVRSPERRSPMPPSQLRLLARTFATDTVRGVIWESPEAWLWSGVLEANPKDRSSVHWLGSSGRNQLAPTHPHGGSAPRRAAAPPRGSASCSSRARAGGACSI